MHFRYLSPFALLRRRWRRCRANRTCCDAAATGANADWFVSIRFASIACHLSWCHFDHFHWQSRCRRTVHQAPAHTDQHEYRWMHFARRLFTTGYSDTCHWHHSRTPHWLCFVFLSMNFHRFRFHLNALHATISAQMTLARSATGPTTSVKMQNCYLGEIFSVFSVINCEFA